MELFLYPPFLDSFGLKADDIEISLNGSLLTRHKGKEAVKHLSMLICCMWRSLYRHSVFVTKIDKFSIKVWHYDLIRILEL